MLLRPRQQELVKRAVNALHQHGNTLAVAPTGAGKTIMLSAIIGALYKGSTANTGGFKANGFKSCVVAHRDELTSQNEVKFCRVNPDISTSLFDASSKSWQGETTFAMVQTLSREQNLATMPPLDLLVIDEAHHARAESYLRIVNHAQSLNPNLKLLGMTATPNRGDKKGLSVLFSNVCDQIATQELILSGHLARPRTYVMDVGVGSSLQAAKKTVGGEYDMDDVAQIMDTVPINEAIVAHWREKAHDRQTVVFCSTVDHARHVTQAFLKEGIGAVLIHGGLSSMEREQVLDTYTTGNARVIVNVSVLTEGWDHPPTSCVVLLRPSSYQSTFIQMIGRGLRTVNAEEYPGLVKKDCLILDFGTATLAHGSLEQEAALEDGKAQTREAPTKTCFECNGIVPAAVRECPLCGAAFHLLEEKPLKACLTEEDFVMREVDLFRNSNFLWLATDRDKNSLMATGLEAWSRVDYRGDQWYALGGLNRSKNTTHLLAVGEKASCLAAANDWMNTRETQGSAYKTKGWLTLPPTIDQLHYLPDQDTVPMTRYQAAVLLTLKFRNEEIEAALSRPVLNQGGKI